MIIQDAINVMKVLKGALISYRITKEDNPLKQMYQIFDKVYIKSVSYQIEDQILKIILTIFIFVDSSLIQQTSL